VVLLTVDKPQPHRQKDWKRCVTSSSGLLYDSILVVIQLLDGHEQGILGCTQESGVITGGTGFRPEAFKRALGAVVATSTL